MTERVLVTGGGGFVACHLIQQLLASGNVVNTTVRNLTNRAKVLPLLTLQKQHPGKLYLFEADLLVDGAFDASMHDCTVVHHVASPFLLPEKIKDGRREMLEPALLGTRNVLSSVDKTPSVLRVVPTSTVGAIFGDYIDVLHMKNKTLTEDYFNTSSTLETNPYHYAKVEAEKEAWRICEKQTRWSLVTINPGMILGPSLTPASDSGSLFLLDEMFRGYFFYGMPDLSLTTVDVRDVAAAHIIAANKVDAQGRYILAEQHMISFVEIAGIVRRLHRRPWLLPRYRIPDAIVRLIGPFFGLTQDYLSKHLGIRFVVDNQRSLNDLGIKYRSITETLTDHYRCWDMQRQLNSQANEKLRS
ncbi:MULTISPECIES: NAD-dependent epimerase/dehydratase family protein [Pseudomonas]|uniref:Cinnamyl-alcohol dehydrogenase-like protein n=4 Tax=Pseudomonas syringae group genomosp. 2 TaxID=251698 RepID=A0A0Q0BNI1_PSEAJ|nr:MULTISPECIES: NAD-dependent epimerase/dehydratase family protein [Pseudomonas syringae group]KPX57979.1 Cinnamyl-alcohol dehydrogenase-like protein [Pseudomonas amygdali pv. lachrymans]KEZ29019.1 cinnamyl-alcohol dehydrogenase [Pseudomonas amygdali pv. tabaci str. 6605]KIY20199.1 cinnamyl-alcohol dehydrogenase [Pseudomonas amygdali pv. tabaci]KPY79775.1 Cinnamyl-alcohol dehydrogenase-like protein [Pseudomonas amygdali pv. tabaci]MDU8606720.1 NAD-dependent epimerase/dehydratase family protei